MRKLLFIILFLCSFECFSAQVFKFNAYQIAFFDIQKEKWDPFEDTDILVSINLDGKKIKIYSKETQSYDIIKSEKKKLDKDGDETLRFYCEDQNGSTCYVDFVVLNSRNGVRQLYIKYSDAQFVYNIKSLD